MAEPIRTCIGCHRVDRASALVRVVRDGAGTVVPDLRHDRRGRGAWMHPSARCVRGASKRLSQALRGARMEGGPLAERLVEEVESEARLARAVAAQHGRAPRRLPMLENLLIQLRLVLNERIPQGIVKE